MLTFKQVQEVFHIPANEAALKLGVCVSSLKKVCRRNGIKRWPYRKIKSLANAHQNTNILSGIATELPLSASTGFTPSSFATSSTHSSSPMNSPDVAYIDTILPQLDCRAKSAPASTVTSKATGPVPDPRCVSLPSPGSSESRWKYQRQDLTVVPAYTVDALSLKVCNAMDDDIRLPFAPTYAFTQPNAIPSCQETMDVPLFTTPSYLFNSNFTTPAHSIRYMT